MACNSLMNTQDIARFRTKLCRRMSAEGGCEFGSGRCQYSHLPFWPRRCPFYISDLSSLRYVPIRCPDISPSEGLTVPITCPRNAHCPFAHSTEEIDYHPLNYKKIPCEKFANRDCGNFYCPDCHCTTEQTPTVAYTLPYTRGMEIPYIENVQIGTPKSRSDENTTPTNNVFKFPISDLPVGQTNTTNAPDSGTTTLLGGIMDGADLYYKTGLDETGYSGSGLTPTNSYKWGFRESPFAYNYTFSPPMHSMESPQLPVQVPTNTPTALNDTIYMKDVEISQSTEVGSSIYLPVSEDVLPVSMTHALLLDNMKASLLDIKHYFHAINGSMEGFNANDANLKRILVDNCKLHLEIIALL